MNARPICLYDAKLQAKRELKPRDPNHIRMYVCGMTTYDFCHIGHARVSVFFDVVARYLRQLGYQLTYVRNITDVDDKIILRAQERKISPSELAQQFITAMQEDFASLGVQDPSHEPQATAYIDDMVAMIQCLEEKGYAYQGASGNVYFEVAKFPSYGQLAGRDLQALQLGARVVVNDDKRGPHDFVLWKPVKPGEVSWPSPWGDGRPGWHIECSAMSTNLLNMDIDIHGGGVDLKFPHHENEKAQSEAACDGHFVNHWMHVGHIQVNKEKMSKSLGNFVTIREMLKHYPGEVIRLMMLQAHYRHPLDYQPPMMGQAQATLLRCYRTMAALQAGLAHLSANSNLACQDQSQGEDIWQSLLANYHSAMCDDFNTPQALVVLFSALKQAQQALQSSDAEQLEQGLQAIRQMAEPLGILQQVPSDYVNWRPPKHQDVDLNQVESLVAERQVARDQKDWSRADALRDQLSALGVGCEDVPGEPSHWYWLQRHED